MAFLIFYVLILRLILIFYVLILIFNKMQRIFKKKCFLLSVFIRIQINKIHFRCRNTMKTTTSQFEQEVM